MYLTVEIEVGLDHGEKTLFIAHDGSSGCEYSFENLAELKKLCSEYVEDALNWEYDESELEELDSLDEDEEEEEDDE